jgi:hypothetical protein
LPGPTELWSDPLKDCSVQVCSARVLQAGEAVAVFQPDQRALSSPGAEVWRIVEGPSRFIPRPDERVVDLQWFQASDMEHLSVVRKDGSVEKIPGPVGRWQDPSGEIESISVCPSIRVASNECVVLFRRLCSPKPAQHSETQEPVPLVQPNTTSHCPRTRPTCSGRR